MVVSSERPPLQGHRPKSEGKKNYFDESHENDTEDPYFVDPNLIPTEKEIQRKLLEQKKAKLRAKFSAAA